jgi:hypothetical protein
LGDCYKHIKKKPVKKRGRDEEIVGNLQNLTGWVKVFAFSSDERMIIERSIENANGGEWAKKDKSLYILDFQEAFKRQLELHPSQTASLFFQFLVVLLHPNIQDACCKHVCTKIQELANILGTNNTPGGEGGEEEEEEQDQDEDDDGNPVPPPVKPKPGVEQDPGELMSKIAAQMQSLKQKNQQLQRALKACEEGTETQVREQIIQLTNELEVANTIKLQLTSLLDTTDKKLEVELGRTKKCNDDFSKMQQTLKSVSPNENPAENYEKRTIQQCMTSGMQDFIQRLNAQRDKKYNVDDAINTLAAGSLGSYRGFVDQPPNKVAANAASKSYQQKQAASTLSSYQQPPPPTTPRFVSSYF